MTKEELTIWVIDNSDLVKIELMKETQIPIDEIEFKVADNNYGEIIGKWRGTELTKGSIDLNDLEKMTFMINKDPKWSEIYSIHKTEIQMLITEINPFTKYTIVESTGFKISVREDGDGNEGFITYSCLYDGIKWNIKEISRK